MNAALRPDGTGHRDPMGDDAPASAALRERAAAVGVATDYTSFWGEPVQVPPGVLQRTLAAMGDATEVRSRTHVLAQGQGATLPAGGPWRLREAEGGRRTVCSGDGPEALLPDSLAAGYYELESPVGEAFVIVAPPGCWVPPGPREGERWWGFSVQLYGLRSNSNWGIGDFGDLRELLDLAATQGAAFVGLSPLHALFAHQPEQATPYSPASRLALNPLFIDVPGLPEFALCAPAQSLVAGAAFQRRLRSLRASAEVRYAEVAALKHEVLRLLWAHFRAQPRGERSRAFDDFRRERADTLGRHALWEAIQCRLHAADASVWGWPAWPAALQRHDSAEVEAFAREHADEVAYRFWLQWVAQDQLAQVQRHARRRMPVGLYCDLAVGANDGGSETWVRRGLFASGVRVGAPPDPLNALGQDWGLPPVNPVALEAARFAPFIELMRSTMRHAGALRMDHVMALMRLFWISPEGGTYVHYPLDALLAIVAVESQRLRCLVIGEDLGNVLPAMREAMRERSVLSYRTLWFERTPEGGLRPPGEWEPRALAVLSTHDLPTLAGFWAGEDIDTQARLHLLPDEGAHSRLVLERAQDRARLLLALEQQGLLPEGASVHAASPAEVGPALCAAVHAYLARTPCWLASVQLEDACGQLHQVNVPGTTEDRHPNWRQRLPVPLEELATLPGFVAVAAAMRRERGAQAVAEPLADTPPLHSADVPLATYRLQFNADNGFARVREAVPYLAALGVSHLYSSPYLKARAGSTHGYDVTDPSLINPEVGTDEEHAALCDALAAHGMGQVLDIVPNHMGVLGADNPWWQDVLAHGQASAHAATFDIEWAPAAPELRGRVLLPVLGDHYGRVLEAGEISLHFDAGSGRFEAHYWEHRLPLDPRGYPQLLSAAPAPAGGEALDEVQSLLDAFGRLPPHDTPEEAAREARRRDAAVHQQRLAELARQHAWLRDWIAAALRALQGRPGEPASVDALDALLRHQAFRLADWRVAGDDINYRRFFDVNALAAVRMEDPAVFEAMHQRVLRWLAEGRITGLRVDHPDGLSRPGEYFTRLQQRHAALVRASGAEPRALYLVVEKILADHEALPEDWPVHGGTGYRFSSLVNGLFVDAAAQAAFDGVYEAFTGDAARFEDTVRECKQHIIGSALSAELGWLTETLYRIAQADRRVCDFTRNRLRATLAEVAADFPVYRTYVNEGEGGASEIDRRHIDWALADARRRLDASEAGLLEWLGTVLAGEPGPAPALRRRFVERWQQFTAPVMAKSVEDTAFYRHVRLASLNDVGSEPRRFGISPAAFHHANGQRARHGPHGLLATSTHDSKRSEDVRARLNVLSEMPARWEDAVLALDALGERLRTEVDGESAPCASDRWALYQTLVGIWPARGAAGSEREALRQRVQVYMRKAVREAKRQSSWLCPNEAYERALEAYIGGALALPAFIAALERFVATVAPWGFRNSLSQLALKFTVPGVPDIYQGCERWNFSLVDPDNRRPVDFAPLAASLAGLAPLYEGRCPTADEWTALLPPCPAGSLKQLVTWRLLQLRRAFAPLFRDGGYLPLAVDGRAAEHAVAFARLHEGRAVVVVACRLLHGLAGRGWGNTRIVPGPAHPVLARTGAWREWMTGHEFETGAQGALPLASLLGSVSPARSRLPFAVLVPRDAP